jgi:branched-chain amino acid transport system permease protein
VESLFSITFLLMNGLIWGLIIALIALGLSLIFGVMGIVNMAHGDLYMIGAVVAFYVVSLLGNFWLALLVAPLLMAVIAAPMERFVLRPYEGNPSLTMIATVGISFIVQTTALAVYGGIPKKISNPWPVSFHILGVSYPGYRFLIALISILILTGLWLFLYRTNYGILVRASMQDRDMANAMGINVNRILITTFVLGAALAAAGGVLAAPIYQVSYLMGNDVILLCFIVVIIGGLGSLEGTLVAALGICALEGMLANFLSPTRARAAIFVVMVIVLMLRPQGLFGARER